MKTQKPLRIRFSIVLMLGFSGAVLFSCSSSKNASNYDRDGIYGSSQPVTDNSSVPNQKNSYKDYFGSLRQDNQPDQIFTDVDSYNSNYSNDGNTSQTYEGSPAWGADPEHVTVNVYNNGWGYNYWNYGWGWNLGWGWNSWYGPYYGWNYDPWYGPYYGYNWGYYPYYYSNYYNSYPHNHYYAYGGGRRVVGGVRTYTNPGRSYSNSSPGVRHYNSGTRYSTNNSVRTYGGTRNYPVRTDSGVRNNTSYSTPRPNAGTRTQVQSQTQPRSTNYDYNATPRNNSYNTPRASSNPSPSNNTGGRASGGGRR